MGNSKDYNREYYRKNKDIILERQKKYREEKKKAEFVELTPEELEAKRKIRKQKANEAARRYYAKNKEKVNAYANEYHKENKEARKMAQRKYYETHKEQIREQQKEYRSKSMK